jgi:hypothetical protein
MPVELFPTVLVFAKPKFIERPEGFMGILFLLVLVASIWGFRKNSWFRWIDFTLFLVTGLLGILVTVLTIWSMHSVLHHNSNLFWTNPVNLIVAFGILSNCKNKWFSRLIVTYALVILLFIPISFFIMQDIPLAGIFVAFILATRMVMYALHQKNSQY